MSEHEDGGLPGDQAPAGDIGRATQDEADIRAIVSAAHNPTTCRFCIQKQLQ